MTNFIRWWAPTLFLEESQVAEAMCWFGLESGQRYWGWVGVDLSSLGALNVGVNVGISCEWIIVVITGLRVVFVGVC